jgi:DNA-binding SARP family transcriptional activator/tetratricopeptide (TPR) repeat protein
VIRIRLLGPPRVERDGSAVVFDTRKALALLAHLCLADGARPRDVLADLLWPDSDLTHARGALRRTLSAVRTAIGAEHLESSRDQVRLVRGEDLEVDVDTFRRSLAEGDPERALAAWGGDLLEGFSVRDVPDFEEWWEGESAVLRHELTGVLGAVAGRREADGDVAGAVSVVRRWLGRDPLHEPAHQALMRLLARTGDRAGALAQYHECERVLARELGVDPLTETTALAAEINRGTAVGMPAPAPARPVSSPAETPLVARDAELGGVVAAHESLAAHRADGQVVVVEGEAGIGKTRLVDEVATSLRARGAVVLRGQAFEDESHLPYRPVIDLLRERVLEDPAWVVGLDDTTLAETARLVPEVHQALARGRSLPRPASPDEPGAETRFLTALWESLIAAVAGPAPGVLVLDDAQWADDASLRLLGFGLRRLHGRPVLVVLTWRTPADHPLLAAVERAGTAVRLHRLDEPSVGQLLATMSAAPVDVDTVHRYWTLSEGVPLILVQYLRAVDEGDGVPDGVREALAARLATVSETAGQVLSAAAVLGRSFDADVLRSVSGRTDEETVTALEELVARGLLREGDADYDFDHALLRTVVYDGTSRARRRLLHGRVADVADAAGLGTAGRARHLRRAGRDRDAASAFRAAGDEARTVYANAEALAHYTAALELGHPDRAAVLSALADVQVVLGDYGGALASLQDAYRSADPGQHGELDVRLGRVQARRGEHGLADEHFAAALAELGDAESERADRAGVVADRALTALAAGDRQRARALADEAWALTDGLPDALADRRATCRAHHLRGLVDAADGDLDSALDHFHRSVDLAREVGSSDLEVAALNNLALVHRRRGELDLAIALTSDALATCSRLGDRHREAALHNNLADLLHAQGRGEEAMVHLKQAVEVFADVGDRDELRPAIWQLVSW